jgi:hypothetical protein
MGVTLLEKIKPASYKILQNSKNSIFCVFLAEILRNQKEGHQPEV